VRRISAVEDTYRDISRELTLEDWMKRPMGVKYVDNVARLTATLQ
jgi:cardiolipin synthase